MRRGPELSPGAPLTNSIRAWIACSPAQKPSMPPPHAACAAPRRCPACRRRRMLGRSVVVVAPTSRSANPASFSRRSRSLVIRHGCSSSSSAQWTCSGSDVASGGSTPRRCGRSTKPSSSCSASTDPPRSAVRDVTCVVAEVGDDALLDNPSVLAALSDDDSTGARLRRVADGALTRCRERSSGFRSCGSADPPMRMAGEHLACASHQRPCVGICSRVNGFGGGIARWRSTTIDGGDL